MLKLVDARVVQIVGMQDLVDQLRFGHDLRDVRNTGDGGDFLDEIVPRAAVFLPGEIRKLNAIEQRVKAQGLGVVMLRLNERG